MALFSWNNKLSVGNSLIDNDHRHLIALLNEFHDEMSAGRGVDALGQVLNELIQYAQQHFKREEDIMERIDYPDFQSHKRSHDQWTSDLMEMQKRFTAGETKMTVGLLKFMCDWLFDHIMTVDKKLGQAIRAGKMGS